MTTTITGPRQIIVTCTGCGQQVRVPDRLPSGAPFDTGNLLCGDCVSRRESPTRLGLFQQQMRRLGIRNPEQALISNLPGPAQDPARGWVKQLCTPGAEPLRIMLTGSTGIGKTHTAYTLIHECLRAGMPREAIRTGTEESLIAPSIPTAGGFPKKRDLNAILGPDVKVVLVDEWGRGNYPGSTHDALLGFVNKVTERNLSVIATTNFRSFLRDPQHPGTSLEERTDPAVFSRMCSLFGTEPRTFLWTRDPAGGFADRRRDML